MFVDFLGIYVASVLAYFLRVGFVFSSDFPFSVFAVLAFVSALVWSLFLVFTKYYRVPPRSGGRVWFDVGLVLVGGIVSVGFLIVTYFFPREIIFSRLLCVYIWLFGCVFLLCSQFIFRWILAGRKNDGKKVYRTLIVGANRVSERLIAAIEDDDYAPYKIIGVIDPYGMAGDMSCVKILGKLDKLEDVCVREKITAIVQCDAFEHTLNLISFCDEKNIKFQFDPALRGVFEKNLRIRETAGVTLISFVRRDFSKKRKRLFYRFVDWGLRQVFDVD